MQRRTLIRAGLGSAAVLAVAGTGLAWFEPAWRNGRLGASATGVMRAIGESVLDGLLSGVEVDREVELEAWLRRLEATIAGMPAYVRSEISQLLTLLAVAPGRRWLADLEPAWHLAKPAQVQAALQGMRTAPSVLRQQAYHALHDLSMAAFAAGHDNWARLGYPGPTEL